MSGLTSFAGYRRIFTRLYEDVEGRDLNGVVGVSPDGLLDIRLAKPPDAVDLGIKHEHLTPSSMLIGGDTPHQHVRSADGRHQFDIEALDYRGISEFWLRYTERESGNFRRIKLNAEGRPPIRYRPRVAVAPGGDFFVVDDIGIVRLYGLPTLSEIGTFQLASPNTDNRLVALAVSADNQYVAGMSSWKNVILYSLPERRVLFVRQIQDKIGWYGEGSAYIGLPAGAEIIVAIGASQAPGSPGQMAYSVNVFKYASAKAT